MGNLHLWLVPIKLHLIIHNKWTRNCNIFLHIFHIFMNPTFRQVCLRQPLLKMQQYIRMAWQNVCIAQQQRTYCNYWPAYCRWCRSQSKNVETLPTILSPRGLRSHIQELFKQQKDLKLLTDVTLGVSSIWLGTRAGAGRASILVRAFWPQPMAPRTTDLKTIYASSFYQSPFKFSGFRRFIAMAFMGIIYRLLFTPIVNSSSVLLLLLFVGMFIVQLSTIAGVLYCSAWLCWPCRMFLIRLVENLWLLFWFSCGSASMCDHFFLI